MPIVIHHRQRSVIAWILPFAMSCTSYAPAAELWPTFDASATGPDLPAGTGGSGVSSAGGGAGASTVETAAGVGGSSTVAGGAGGNDSTGEGGSSGGSGAGGLADAGNSGGRGGSSGAGGTKPGDAGSSGTCSLSVTVTTVTDNGQYSPRNVGAIWISKSNDTFVKTLAVWARSRISRLTLWNSVTSSAGQSDNTVDAITGATLSSHQTHKVSWNCTDTSRMGVPDGAYRVNFEMTDKNSAGPHMSIDFTKGPMPFNLSPPDQPNFKGISLVFVP